MLKELNDYSAEQTKKNDEKFDKFKILQAEIIDDKISFGMARIIRDNEQSQKDMKEFIQDLFNRIIS